MDPDTGTVTDGFDASQRIPTEALFHAKRGDVAHRVTLEDSGFPGIANFGVMDVFTPIGPTNDYPTVINELLVDPLFGDRDVDQLLEIRGAPNGTLNSNTYFVIVDEENLERGVIHGIFDLSNHALERGLVRYGSDLLVDLHLFHHLGNIAIRDETRVFELHVDLFVAFGIVGLQLSHRVVEQFQVEVESELITSH